MDKREQTIADRIAAEVRRARKERGWSQQRLAEQADLSVNYVSLIERGERLPSVEVLLRLAGTLGTTIGALVAETPGQEDPWLTETGAILRALPETARPMVLGMLRGASGAQGKPEGSGVRKRR